MFWRKIRISRSSVLNKLNIKKPKRRVKSLNKKSKEDNDEDGGSKKGDLQISYDGTKYQVELKTEMGGAARFGDQQVRPAEGFEAAAVTLNSYVKSHKMYRNLSRKISGSGVNLNQAIEFASYLQGADVNKFLGLVRRCVTLIFLSFYAFTKSMILCDLGNYHVIG